MACIFCGNNTNSILCDKCYKKENFDEVFNTIANFKPDLCENKYLLRYSEKFDNKYELKNVLMEIVKELPEEDFEYYNCKTLKIVRSDKFEEEAIKYLNKFEKLDSRKQNILCDLLYYYHRNNYEKPEKWSRIMLEYDKLAIELYIIAAEYFSMVGDYDLSKKLLNKAKKELAGNNPYFIFSNKENMTISINRISSSIERYENGKPFWPATEERRLALSKIYDKKNIKYPRITLKPVTIKENEFKPITELYDKLPNKYVVFWCSETYNVPSIKGIYEIAAIQIENDKIVKEFSSLVKPWDGIKEKQYAAKKSGLPISDFENADDVDVVMKKFIDFIQEEPLTTTEALGNQAKLLTRALRYSGIDEIKNKFYDILDYAADINQKFDLENNNREYLLKYYNLKEGASALEKTKISQKLLKKLKEDDKQ